MNKPNQLSSIILALSFYASTPIAFAGVTAVNNDQATWDVASWTNGIPTSADAAFLNGKASVTIPDGVNATAQGIRAGDTNRETATLQIDGGTCNVLYVVVGNAPISSGSVMQTGGALTVKNTPTIDFELGNPMNSPTADSDAIVTFSGGQANLADVRFNIRANRKCSLTIIGSDPVVKADTLTAETRGETNAQEATLSFILDQKGVAPLKVAGVFDLGDSDQFNIHVDGDRYNGQDSRITLIEAANIEGDFAGSTVEGLSSHAKIEVEDNKVVLKL